MRISLKSTLAAFAILVTVAIGQAEAQRPLIIAAGPVFASTNHEDSESKTGLFVAAGTSFQINESWAIEPFVGFVQKGDSIEDEDLNINVIEIPVFASTSVALGESLVLNLSAGPQVSFVIGCEYEFDGETADCEDDFGETVESFEFGLIGNANIGFPLGESLTGAVGVAYDYGLVDVIEEFDSQTRTIFLYGSIGIPLGGM